jgi:hypothetical protein
VWRNCRRRVAELGQLMRGQDGVTGAYLLDDHHEMMRDNLPPGG